MLIEFSLANYRSIHDRQTISMVPGPSKIARGRFSHATSNKHIPYVLKFASLFGGNGAGKSNLVKAIADYRRLVTSSHIGDDSNSLELPHFKLDPNCAQKPTELEAVFLKDGTLFQYGFSILNDKVVSEWLFATPQGGRLQRWLERGSEIDGPRGIYINPTIQGERRTWIESTRDNALVLSTAIGLNANSLRAPFDWIRDSIRVISEPSKMTGSSTAEMCSGRDKTRAINILRDCGVDVRDIVIREEEIDFSLILNEEFIKNSQIDFGKPQKRVFFIYNDINGHPVEMSLADESDGTRVLFSIIEPLLNTTNSKVLVADELHRSLHPLAFKYIIERFFLNPETSGRGQLVFTTHETHALSSQVSHPDQIYMVEKDKTGSTRINPLSDFKVRSGEAVRAGYLAGRYGGLPTRHLHIPDESY